MFRINKIANQNSVTEIFCSILKNRGNRTPCIVKSEESDTQMYKLSLYIKF